MRVLHVVEALGGGVAAVLEDYIAGTPEVQHAVLAARRPNIQIGDRVADSATWFGELPDRHPARVAVVRRAVRRLRPDVVHAHSSYAGFYVRVAATRLPPVVYTPHGYAFERADLSTAARRALRLLEGILNSRTECVAAVGPREAELARCLLARSRVVYVPNVARVPVRRIPDAHVNRQGSTLRVAAVGRLTPARDPRLFAAAAAAAIASGVAAEWVWIGGGDPEDERALRDAGVHVTGWMPRQQVLDRLADVDVFVHTAAWDGSPIAVLEAAAFHLPILARRIPPLVSLGLENLFDGPEELVALVAQHGEERVRERSCRSSSRLHARHSPEAQRAALLEAYGIAAESSFDGRGRRHVRSGPLPAARSPARSTRPVVAARARRGRA